MSKPAKIALVLPVRLDDDDLAALLAQAIDADVLERRRALDEHWAWSVIADGEVVGRGIVYDIDWPARRACCSLVLEKRTEDSDRESFLALDSRAVIEGSLTALAERAHRELNLHRVEVELPAGSTEAAAAEAAGFVIEGTRREHAIRDGAYYEIVAFGKLATDPNPDH